MWYHCIEYTTYMYKIKNSRFVKTTIYLGQDLSNSVNEEDTIDCHRHLFSEVLYGDAY